MVFALTRKEPLPLVVYCHHIDLSIIVHIVQPVRTDPGRGEVQCAGAAERGENILAHILIGKGHEFLHEILFKFI